MTDLATPHFRWSQRAATALTLCCALLLNACDPFNGAGIFLDCIDDDGPVLTPRELPIPVLNHSYEAIITASIENEPYDDRYEYTFYLGAGLPAGLIVDTFGREVRISGAPTQLGNYAMRVEVTVKDASGDEGESRLCRRKTARNYVFKIQQGN